MCLFDCDLLRSGRFCRQGYCRSPARLSGEGQDRGDLPHGTDEGDQVGDLLIREIAVGVDPVTDHQRVRSAPLDGVTDQRVRVSLLESRTAEPRCCATLRRQRMAVGALLLEELLAIGRIRRVGHLEVDLADTLSGLQEKVGKSFKLRVRQSASVFSPSSHRGPLSAEPQVVHQELR